MATETVSIIIKAFDQTQKALRSIQAAFGKLSKVFFSFKTALVAAVGAGGLGLLISNSLKATDALAKTAGRIGTTTEALSALQYAGQLTGVEVNTMNMALQRFTRRTAEAAVGTGEAKGALRELNIDARKLTQLPLDQQMLTLADAFEEAKTKGVNPLKIAFKLFDSEGAALVNTLALGRDGLTDLIGEARMLGVVMSAKAAKGVEDANDALFRMQSLFSGVVKQTVASLAPAISALADLITKKVSASFGKTDESVKKFADGLATYLIDGLIIAIKGFEKLSQGVSAFANELILIKGRMTGLFTPDDQKSASELAVRIHDVTETLKMYQRQQTEGNNRQKRNAPKHIARLTEELAVLKEMQRVREESGDLGLFTAFDSGPIVTTLESIKGKIGTTTESLSDLAGNLQDEMPSAFETFMASLQRTRQLAGDLTPQLEKLGDQAITGLGDSFTSAITGAKNFSDAIKSMAKSVVDSLIRILVQKYLVDAAFGAITGGFGGGAGAGAGAGGGGGGLPQFANGGVATGGRPAIVGEKGPELFIPSTTGRVVPNDQLGGGGVTVVQHINVTTGVQQTVRAEIANLLPQISNAAKAAVADSRMRGGGFSKAMVGA
jgi:hypothetical protein